MCSVASPPGCLAASLSNVLGGFASRVLSRFASRVLGGFAVGCLADSLLGALPASLLACSVGTRRAVARCMGVRDFRELICWQLSYELKCEVFAFTATEPASRDFKYCDQIRDSSSSSPRNIAEGFGRFTPGEFAQYLKWARASLMETMNSLIDGNDRGYLEPAVYSRLMNLARAALKATTNLMLAKQRQADATNGGRSRKARGNDRGTTSR